MSVAAQEVIFDRVFVPQFVKSCQEYGVRFNPNSQHDVLALLKMASDLSRAETAGIVEPVSAGLSGDTPALQKAAMDLHTALYGSGEPEQAADGLEFLADPQVKAALQEMQTAEAAPASTETPTPKTDEPADKDKKPEAAAAAC